MGGATHIHMQLNTVMNALHASLEWLNLYTPLVIPIITKLTILTPIPLRGVRLGARTCILATQFLFPKLPLVGYKLLNFSKQILKLFAPIIHHLEHMKCFLGY